MPEGTICLGYMYAGVQNGNMCYCDNHYGHYHEAPYEECMKPCPASDVEKCGGWMRNAIYHTGYDGTLIEHLTCKENISIK